MKKYLSVVMTAAMAASLVTGCKKSGSSSSSGGGGGGGSPAQTQAIVEVISMVGMQALVRSAGAVRPAAITNYTVTCPSGGTISVNGSGASSGVSGT